MTIAANQRASAADILVEHNADGTHGAITCTTITASGIGTFATLNLVSLVVSSFTLINTIDEISTDGTMLDNSDTAVPTEAAVVAFVASQVATANEFTELTDTPANYVGAGGQGVRVNVGATGLEFYTLVDTDEKCGVDALATPDYLGAAAGDGILRVDGTILTWTDGGDFVTLALALGAVDHNSLLNYSANRHIDHTAVSVSSGGILSGGGTIDANQTISLAHGDVDHDQTLNYVSGQHVLHSGVTISTTSPLTGGGDITANRTFAISTSADFTTSGTWQFGRINLDAVTEYIDSAAGDLTFTDTNAGTYTLTQLAAAGATSFTALTDTPANYVGSALYYVRVNAGANALEFVAAPGADTLQTAYTAGQTIATSGGNAVAISTANTINAICLTLAQNDTTNNPNAATITNAGTGTGVLIDQNGIGIALQVDSEATTANIIDIPDPALTTGYAINITSANALTSGRLIHLASNSTDVTTRYLLNVSNSNASATGTYCARFYNASTTANVILSNVGNGAHLSFAGDPVKAAPVDGDMWYTGSSLYFRDGTVTRDLIEATDTGLNFVVGNGSDVIATGQAGYIEVPFTGTITRVTMMADVSTTTTVDIWKDTYANYPPTDADSITAAAVPTITAALKAQDSTLTGWTVAVAEGDILGFNVDANDNATRISISLKIRK